MSAVGSLHRGAPAEAPRQAPRPPELPLDEDVFDLLAVVLRLSLTAVPEVEGATVTLLSGGGRQPQTVSSTSEAVRSIDLVQYRTGSGPCVEAAAGGGEVVTPLPTERWPELSRAAGPAGIRSLYSFPLAVRETTSGSLNVYSRCSAPWSDEAARSARLIATQLMIVLASASARADTEQTNVHLREALVTRALIGQAQGVLMARQNITADEAFDILRRASQRANRKLRDVAADVVARFERPQHS